MEVAQTATPILTLLEENAVSHDDSQQRRGRGLRKDSHVSDYSLRQWDRRDCRHQLRELWNAGSGNIGDYRKRRP